MKFKVGDKVELQNCDHYAHCGILYLEEMTIVDIDSSKHNKFPYKCKAGNAVCEFKKDELELINNEGCEE
ncbi:hypothetical protein V8167_001492 [Providencia rettgeri]